MVRLLSPRICVISNAWIQWDDGDETLIGGDDRGDEADEAIAAGEAAEWPTLQGPRFPFKM